jgi:hypothetical protein
MASHCDEGINTFEVHCFSLNFTSTLRQKRTSKHTAQKNQNTNDQPHAIAASLSTSRSLSTRTISNSKMEGL